MKGSVNNMSEHLIEGLMQTAMNSIEDMIDVNTIIGEPIETSNDIVIIPISKVSFGFAAGGSEFKGETVDEYKKQDKDESIQYRLPFGGGSGAGVSIRPISFLVVQQDKVKLLPVNHSSCVDKILDYIPELFDKIECMIDGKNNSKENSTDKETLKVDKKELKKKSKISRIPKTVAEKLDKKSENKNNDEEIQQELEDLFEDEYEYDDE